MNASSLHQMDGATERIRRNTKIAEGYKNNSFNIIKRLLHKKVNKEGAELQFPFAYKNVLKRRPFVDATY